MSEGVVPRNNVTSQYLKMDAYAPDMAGPSDAMYEPDARQVKHKRTEAKEHRRRKRRMQLAAALIEADNDEIQQRIDFLVNVDPSSKELLNNYSLLPKYANQSIMFHGAIDASGWQHYPRPVYVHPPQSMRSLTQSYLGMAGKLVGDDSGDLHILDESTAAAPEPTSVEEVAQNLLSINLPDEELAPSMEKTWDAVEEKASKRRPQLRNASSLPTIPTVDNLENSQDLSLDTSQINPETQSRSALLLARIRKSRIVSDSKASEGDVSADLDDSQQDNKPVEQQETQHDSGPERLEPPVSHESIESSDPVSGSLSDLQGFRARVLKSRPDRRRSSRRHSLAVSGWPGEGASNELLQSAQPESGPETYSGVTTLQLQRLARGGEDENNNANHGADGTGNESMQAIAPLLARRASTHHKDLSSSKWTKRKHGLRALFPFERRKPPSQARMVQDEPMLLLDVSEDQPGATNGHTILTEPSPIVDPKHTETFSAPQPYQDDELVGVSLQTPIVDQPPHLEASHPVHEPAPASAKLPQYETQPTDSFEPNEVAPPPRAQRITFICIPAPLEHMPREYPQTAFYVPHGAFYVDDRGVVLPRNKTQNEAHYELDFGPVEVPAGIGRRVLYPTTALFRNVLVTRDEDHEGWGFERFTNALAYFSALHADDDDSDDEVPLMDVRIQTKEEQLARRRIHRERVRRKRARMERHRLRELAKRQGKRASVFGIPEESSESASDGVSTDYSSFSSDESDPEQLWKDDRRPAGKLYGKSLLGMANEYDSHKLSRVRFYGQDHTKNVRHSAPADGLSGFHNDTRERMAKVFGPQPRWMSDLARRDAENATDQLKTLSVGGTPLLGEQEQTDLLMEPGVQEGIIFPSVHDAQEAEARAAEEADDVAVAAWQDSSSSDEEPEADRKSARFQPEKPRWEAQEEDDLPLDQLRRRSAPVRAKPTMDDSDDEQPLGNRHRQAAIIAENQALIRQLMEENRQVRMSLQMLTSAPYVMPWMPPQLPGQFAPMPHFDEDAPLLGDEVQDVGIMASNDAAALTHYGTTPVAQSKEYFDAMRSSMYSSEAPMPMDMNSGLGLMTTHDPNGQAEQADGVAPLYDGREDHYIPEDLNEEHWDAHLGLPWSQEQPTRSEAMHGENAQGTHVNQDEGHHYDPAWSHSQHDYEPEAYGHGQYYTQGDDGQHYAYDQEQYAYPTNEHGQYAYNAEEQEQYAYTGEQDQYAYDVNEHEQYAYHAGEQRGYAYNGNEHDQYAYQTGEQEQYAYNADELGQYAYQDEHETYAYTGKDGQYGYNADEHVDHGDGYYDQQNEPAQYEWENQHPNGYNAYGEANGEETMRRNSTESFPNPYPEQSAAAYPGELAPQPWDAHALHREVSEWLAAPELRTAADIKGPRFEELADLSHTEQGATAQPTAESDLLDLYSTEM